MIAKELGRLNRRLMDLKIDFAFKQLFGQKRNEDILLAFLNALFHREEADRIVSAEFPNTELAAEQADDKSPRLDVYVLTDTGEAINVEIQVTREAGMAKRTLYYWASLYSKQGKRGDSYEKLKRTITVNILDYRQFPSTAPYHTTYHVIEDTARFRLSEALEIHFIEMPKWRDLRKGHAEGAVRDPLERWVSLLDASENEGLHRALEAMAVEDQTLGKAMDLWEEISRDPENWAAYMSRHKAIKDEASWRELEKRTEEELRVTKERLRESEEAWQAAAEHERVLERAAKEAEEREHRLEQEAKEAESRGRERERFELAVTMLQKGMALTLVSEVTGISVEDLSLLESK